MGNVYNSDFMSGVPDDDKRRRNNASKSDAGYNRTKNCPCDPCPDRYICEVECAKFQRWVRKKQFKTDLF